MDTDPAAVYQPEDLIKIGLAMPVEFPPGEGFYYSNTNTVLLGRIVEQLTGSSLEAEIQRRILDRLGMAQSSFPTSSGAMPDPHPQGYTYGTFVETADTNVLPGRRKPRPAPAHSRRWTSPPPTRPGRGARGAGISTVDDLVRYLPALVGGGLLSPELQQERLDSIRPIDPANPQSPGYGLALAQFGPMYGHTGELPGFNTFAGYDPKRKITVVVWSSLAPAPDGQDPAAQLARTVIGELYRTP